MTRFNLCFLKKISVGFHVGFGCKPKPHMQSLAASDGSRSTDIGVLFGWLPCWFPAFRVWGRSPWEGTMGVHVGFHVGFQLSGYEGGHHGKGTVLASMLASMLVSSFQGMGEVTMGKVPWGSMLLPCWLLGFHVGFHFQVMGEVTAGVHVGFHVSSCQGMGEVTMGKEQWGSWFPAFRV